MLRVAQRSCFCIHRCLLFADVRLTQDSESFSVGCHQAVLDAVVNHLYEVAGAVGAAVKIAQLCGTVELLASWRSWDVARAGRQPPEDRIETIDDLILAADHHAVASFQTPHASARADVDVVNSLRRQFLCPPDIVDIVRIAAIDDRVAGLEVGQETGDGFVHDGRRDH